MAKIRIVVKNGTIQVLINGQEYSAEAFEATPHTEMGITQGEARDIARVVDNLRERM